LQWAKNYTELTPIINRSTIKLENTFINIPNPFVSRNSTLTLQRQNGDELLNLTIYNSTGLKVYFIRAAFIRWEGKNQSGAILEAGVYVVKLGSGSDAVYKKLLIVR